ncbi:hypothetical protein BHE74_00017327 [Ensete ventricosum]|uniref:Uncharacterized protein n=1 Tax=Ensete ventricosum TaxID=4639 RepID=A0A444E0R6_ENSVE|nr:hypothetical protein B296_00009013 [Ensete ventricosum]RWW03991.1 hypothetical protein GW17_00032809 [Ensete ventricosum]RWW74720.1 hypothetical protein BHE74_00017327 [Ensete ventricosum]RZR90279.1 hypothetical protein BHM03_00018132 [Ensete ventricosum]
MAGMANGDEEEGRNYSSRGGRVDGQWLRKATTWLLEEEDNSGETTAAKDLRQRAQVEAVAASREEDEEMEG